MPKGPQGQKRKADVIGNAVLIARIATGASEDTPPKGTMKESGSQETSKSR